MYAYEISLVGIKFYMCTCTFYMVQYMYIHVSSSLKSMIRIFSQNLPNNVLKICSFVDYEKNQTNLYLTLKRLSEYKHGTMTQSLVLLRPN